MSVTTPTAFWNCVDESDEIGSLDLTNNGTVTFSGNQAILNGSSQYLSHADNATLDIGDFDFSYAAWIYPTSVAAGHKYVFSKYNSFEEVVLNLSGASLVFNVASGGASVTHGTALSANTRYLVVCTHDATANTLGISLNGGAYTTDVDTGIVSSTDGIFAIGARSVPDRYFPGRIGPFGFWKNYALTAAEVTEFYNGGTPITYPFPGGGFSGSLTAPSLIRTDFFMGGGR